MILKANKERIMLETIAQNLSVTHVFVSPFRNESRVIKEMHSLKKAVPDVHISFVGMKDRDQLPYEIFEESFQIFREDIKTRSLPKIKPVQVVKYIEWIWRASRRIKKLAPTLIHCHSLGALPAAVLAKNHLKCALIYDAHELETERTYFKGLERYISQKLERFFMKFVDEILVVSPSIQDFYQNLYPQKKIELLVNAPSISDFQSTQGINLKEEIGLTNKEFLFVYMGDLTKRRGIETYLEVFKQLESPHHLLFLGDGYFREDIMNLSRERRNIHWLPPVPHNQVINTLRSADVMLRILETSELSYLYSLPNSVFQAEMAGVPYLVNKECIDIVKFFQKSSLCIPIERNVEVLYEWCKNYTLETFPKREGIGYAWEDYETNLFNAYKNALQTLGDSHNRRHGPIVQ